MTKFRKKPVVIEAFRWMIDEVPDWWKGHPDVHVEVHTGRALIYTLEGLLAVNIGDWIIQGVTGELYPCKPGVFEMTYERVL